MSKIKRLFPAVTVIFAVLILVGLGCWQLQRLAWKERLINAYEQAAATAPTPVKSLHPYHPDAQYRRVTVTGTYLPNQELHLGGRRLFGQTGYQILTPLKTAQGDIFLINRGWVPSEMKDPARRHESLLSSPVVVTGMIRLPEKPGPFTPANHPEKNFWFTVDIKAMEQATGLLLQPLTIEIIDPKALPTIFPVPADGKVMLRNDHLGYALTWFSLAFAAAIIGWLRLRCISERNPFKNHS